MADLELLKKVYRIFSWVSLAALILVVILVLRKAPPPQVAEDPGAAARAEQKFAAADQAKAAGQPAAVSLDPAELNSYLKQNLQIDGGAAPASASGGAAPDADAGVAPPADATSSASTAGSSDDPLAGVPGGDQATIEQVQSSVKDVKVDMVGDLVKAYVIFNFHGKDLSLELDGHLSSDGGYIKFDPVAGKLGSLPLPLSTLQSAVDKMMNSPENRDKLKLPPDISDIQVQNGQAMVTYK